MKFSLAAGAAAVLAAPTALAIESSSIPYVEKVNGKDFEFVTYGGPFNHFTLTDNNLVVTDSDGDYAYGTVDEKGDVVATQYKLGDEVDEETLVKAGTTSRPLPVDVDAFQGDSRRRLQADAVVEAFRKEMQDLEEFPATPKVMKNLVVLLRFADHKTRDLPQKSDYETLFNFIPEAGEPYPDIIPTGSVREAYLEYSYGKLDLQTTVADWYDTSLPEKRYGNNAPFVDGAHPYEYLHREMKAALISMEANGFEFAEFDSNNDTYIDVITFIHSGYDAAAGGTDAYNTTQDFRVWSHKWSLGGVYEPYGTTDNSFTSKDGIVVDTYNINPGVWGLSGSEILHRAVICHETGHFFGLPDFYDRDSTSTGLGMYGLMSNSWGWTGSQRYPQHFSAFSKVFLGFATPIELTTSGEYTIAPMEETGAIYKISEGFKDGEYILIENKQPRGTDQEIPNPGLFIYHIDERGDKYGVNQNDWESFPLWRGWPDVHHQVRTIQHDGKFEMEMSRMPYYRRWSDPEYRPPADYDYHGDCLDVVGEEVSSVMPGGLNPYHMETPLCQTQDANLNIAIKLTAAADGNGNLKFEFIKGTPVECDETIPTKSPTPFPAVTGTITAAPTANWTSINEGCEDAEGWFDKESFKGETLYDCAWYADEEDVAPVNGVLRAPRGSRCNRFSIAPFANNGLTARQACCVCGSRTKAEETVAPTNGTTNGTQTGKTNPLSDEVVVTSIIAAAIVVALVLINFFRMEANDKAERELMLDVAAANGNPGFGGDNSLEVVNRKYSI